MHRVKTAVCRLLFVLFCLLPALFFMNMDTFRTGDEIISYGMANEPEQGWMFSKGRIRSYMEENILRDGAAAVPGHLLESVGDVLKNRGDAAFFRTERPGETGWYSGSELQGYLKITPGEAFRMGDVYLNAMGDDANSFLYYTCLHLVSSIFPGISASKWSGFLLNLFCMAGCLLLMYRISAFFIGQRSARLVLLAAYACSAGALSMFTIIRPYALAVVLQEALLLVHLNMLQKLENCGRDVAKKDMKWLVLLYILGFTAHYTTGIWAVCLAAYTVCRSGRDRRFIRRYLLTGGLAVFLGICIDPMSAVGLLSKRGTTESAGLPAVFAELLRALTHDLCTTVVFLLIPALILLAALCRRIRSKDRGPDIKFLLFAALPFSYILLSVLLMRVVKIRTMIPYLFILLGMLAIYALGEKRRVKTILGAFVLLLWLGGSFAGTAEDKMTEGRVNLLLEERMAMYGRDAMVFVRAHGAGYERIPLLGSFDRTYLLTTDEGWQEEIPELLSAAEQSGLILFDEAEEALSYIKECLKEEGKDTEILFTETQCTLLRIIG